MKKVFCNVTQNVNDLFLRCNKKIGHKGLHRSVVLFGSNKEFDEEYGVQK